MVCRYHCYFSLTYSISIWVSINYIFDAIWGYGIMLVLRHGPSSQKDYILMGQVAKEENTHMLLTIVTVSQRKQTRGWDGDEWGQAEPTVDKPFWDGSIFILIKRGGERNQIKLKTGSFQTKETGHANNILRCDRTRKFRKTSRRRPV